MQQFNVLKRQPHAAATRLADSNRSRCEEGEEVCTHCWQSIRLNKRESWAIKIQAWNAGMLFGISRPADHMGHNLIFTIKASVHTVRLSSPSSEVSTRFKAASKHLSCSRGLGRCGPSCHPEWPWPRWSAAPSHSSRSAFGAFWPDHAGALSLPADLADGL